MLDHDRLAHSLVPAVVAAGRAVLEHRRRGIRAQCKSDGSPVTAADRDAEAILLVAIMAAMPGVPVLAEEAESALGRAGGIAVGGPIAMVDPLDGTREFVAGGDDFTVNIGIAVDGVPSFGVILQPTSGRLFVTMGPERAVEANATMALDADGAPVALAKLGPCGISTREPDASALRALASRSHVSVEAERFLARCGVAQTAHVGSSLKFCLLACGEADVYPRFGPTHVWDTCAGQAILTAAGGVVTTVAGDDLVYDALLPPFLNPGFIAWGRRSLVGRPAKP